MALIIQKFGGTSVSNIERIRKVAQIIKQELDNGNRVIVVVSAMSGATNNLVSLAKQLGAFEGDEEYDAIVSAGEQITAGLVAQSLREISLKSRSFLAWQLPIVTDANFGKANIKSINTYILKEYVKIGGVPVITGFQGVCDGARITTFGRGGSDLTAVAIAASLNADRCDIYTDVDGIFTADPMIIPGATRIDAIDYSDMLEMSYSGAKVLQSRAVEYAIKYNVPVRVLSSFVKGDGTLISKYPNKEIAGIALTDNLEKINISFSGEDNFTRLIDFFNNNLVKFDIESRTNNSVAVFLNKDEVHFIIESLQLSGIIEKIEYEPRKLSSPNNLSKLTVIGKGSNKILNSIKNLMQLNKINIVSISPYNSKIVFWVESSLAKKAMHIIHENCILNRYSE